MPLDVLGRLGVVMVMWIVVVSGLEDVLICGSPVVDSSSLVVDLFGFVFDVTPSPLLDLDPNPDRTLRVKLLFFLVLVEGFLDGWPYSDSKSSCTQGG